MLSKNRNQQELSFTVGVNQHGNSTLKDSLVVSSKTEHNFPQDPAIRLLDIYPNEVKNLSVQTCTQIFIGVLFTTAKPGSNQDILQ